MTRHGVLLAALGATVMGACSGHPLQHHAGADGAADVGAARVDGAAGVGADGSVGAAGVGAAGAGGDGAADAIAVDGSSKDTGVAAHDGSAGTDGASDAGPPADGGADLRADTSEVSPDADADAGGADADAGAADADAGTADADAGGTDADAAALLSCPATDDDGGASESAECLVATAPTSFCTVTLNAIAPATLCPGEAACPATLSAQLGCADLGYPYAVMSLAPRSDGASISVDVELNDGTGELDTQVFTIASGGASRVDHFSSLGNGVMTTDRAGVANFFAASPTGGWRFRQRANAWVRESFTPTPPLQFPEIAGVRAVDDTHAFAILNSGGDLQLATRDTAGWKFLRIDGLAVVEDGLALDLDADGHPWLATVGEDPASNGLSLKVVSSSGAVDPIGTFDTNALWRTPVVLAGGLAGTDARPAVAFAQTDGLHVATPTGPVSGWAQRLVPNSAAKAVDTTECPAQSDIIYGAVCQQFSCDEHVKGAVGVPGLSRTASGVTFAAWLDVEATETYEVSHENASLRSAGLLV